MPLRHARTFFACLLALPILACGANIEEQTAFKAVVEHQDRAAKDIDAMNRRLSVIDRDLQQVSLDVAETLKKTGTGGGGNPEAIAALDTRLQKIEGILGSTAQSLTALNARLDKLESGAKTTTVAAARPKLEGDESVAVSTAPAEKPVADKALVVNKKPAASTPTRAATPRQEAKQGMYHTVAAGQTISTIARTFRVSESTIRQANGVPAGRDVLAGQRIYVPGAVR